MTSDMVCIGESLSFRRDIPIVYDKFTAVFLRVR